jgi:hypothetical protein
MPRSRNFFPAGFDHASFTTAVQLSYCPSVSPSIYRDRSTPVERSGRERNFALLLDKLDFSVGDGSASSVVHLAEKARDAKS